MERTLKRTAGYILIEAMMAMALLSIGMLTIHGAIRQTIIVRGQARDYTQARLLIEDILARIEIQAKGPNQPQLMESSDSGRFKGDLSRFSWKWTISKIDVPLPPMPPDTPPEIAEAFELTVSYVTKVDVTVSWKRSGRRFKETFETLLPPETLWLPPPPEFIPEV